MIGMDDDSVTFEDADHDAVTARPNARGNPFARYIGILSAFTTMDEIHAWLHDLRGHDESEASEGIDQETPP